MFKELVGDTALICKGGVYMQVGLWLMSNHAIMVKVGSGFARIYENGATSVPNLRVVELHSTMTMRADGYGRLTTLPGARLAELDLGV